MTSRSWDLLFTDDRVTWRSQRDLRFATDGRCSARFPAEFPFLMHFYNASANYQTRPNFHDYLEVFFVYDGRGTFDFGDKRYEFNRGDLFVIGSDETHNCSRCYDGDTKTIELYFMPELIYNPGSNQEDLCYLLPFYNHDREFAHRMPCGSIDGDEAMRQMGLIFQELRAKDTFFRSAVSNHLRQFLLILSRHYQRSLGNGNDSGHRLLDVKRLVAVADYIRENYQDHLSLGSVARQVCMSREAFCRFFRRATGSTLTDYLHRFRVARARDLLEQDAMPITHVAFDVGFQNYSHFERVFREITRLSPTEYRNRHAKAVMGASGHWQYLPPSRGQ